MDSRRIRVWDMAQRNNDKGALSGCGFDETISTSFIGDKMRNGCNVLEVGVGLGYVTQELKERGFNVSACDLSLEALKRVHRFCEHLYNFDQIQNIPSNYFDVIIMVNVLQHIPTPELYYELFHFIRSLKRNGTMVVNSIATDIMEDTGDDPDLKICDRRLPHPYTLKANKSIGCYCRKLDYIKKIIDRCGGVAELKANNPVKFWHITESHVIHITKKYNKSVYAG